MKINSLKFNNSTIHKMYHGNELVNKIGDAFTYMEASGDTPTPPTPVPYDEQYFTFVAEDDNASVKLTYAHNNVFQYSVDNGTTWSNLADNQTTSSVNSGETIMFKAENPSTNGIDGIGVFALSATNRFSVQGNIMSLIYGDNFIGQTTLRNTYQFASLLWNCSGLISAEHLILPATTLTNLCYNSMLNNCPNLIKAPELPATTLARNCYGGIFKNCTSLTTAPELPATTLTSNCYVNMFLGCTSLTTAPVLSATTLAEYCYQHMFEGCTSLNYIKCLATNISARDCTDSWVYNVASTGTFVKAASMSNWTTGEHGIPRNWTVQNNDGGGEPSTDVPLENTFAVKVNGVWNESMDYVSSINDIEMCLVGMGTRENYVEELAIGNNTEDINLDGGNWYNCTGLTLAQSVTSTSDIHNFQAMEWVNVMARDLNYMGASGLFSDMNCCPIYVPQDYFSDYEMNWSSETTEDCEGTVADRLVAWESYIDPNS